MVYVYGVGWYCVWGVCDMCGVCSRVCVCTGVSQAHPAHTDLSGQPPDAGVALGWSSVPGKRPVLQEPVLSVHRTLKPVEVDLNQLEATGDALQLDRPLSPGDGPLRCPLSC